MGLLDCKVIVTQSCLILCDPMDCSPLCPWNSPGNEVGCHFLLQGNLPNPGIVPRSPTLQADSLATEPPEKPSSAHGILQARILEWVAITFSRESSQPRDGIQVSLIAGKFFANWAARETPYFIVNRGRSCDLQFSIPAGLRIKWRVCLNTYCWPPSPVPGASDSGGLRWSREFAFLSSSQGTRFCTLI